MRRDALEMLTTERAGESNARNSFVGALPITELLALVSDVVAIGIEGLVTRSTMQFYSFLGLAPCSILALPAAIRNLGSNIAPKALELFTAICTLQGDFFVGSLEQPLLLP